MKHSIKSYINVTIIIIYVCFSVMHLPAPPLLIQVPWRSSERSSRSLATCLSRDFTNTSPTSPCSATWRGSMAATYTGKGYCCFMINIQFYPPLPQEKGEYGFISNLLFQIKCFYCEIRSQRFVRTIISYESPYFSIV